MSLNHRLNALDHPELEAMTFDDVQQRLTKTHGAAAAPRIIAAFRQRTPDAKPFDIWSRANTAPLRRKTQQQAMLHADGGKAPAGLYWFAWQTPILDGRPRAFHCAELPFVFDNTDRCNTMTGGGDEARALAATVSDAWIAFARSGDLGLTV